MATERTFSIIKPDACRRNLTGAITAKLEEAGLVKIQKRFVHKKPNTNVALTALGKQRIAHHWDQLERLKNLSKTTDQQ